MAATMDVDMKPITAVSSESPSSSLQKSAANAERAGNAHAIGLEMYFKNKIEEMRISVADRLQTVQRLEAQRTALNSQGTKFHCTSHF